MHNVSVTTLPTNSTSKQLVVIREGRVAIGFGFTDGHVRTLEIEAPASAKALTPATLIRVADHWPEYVALAKHILALDVPKPETDNGHRPHQRLTPEFLARVASDYQELTKAKRHAATEIAQRHGVTPSTVSSWLRACRERGLLPKQRRKRTPKPMPETAAA